MIRKGRFAATLDGDFVVFLIGVRMTNFWKIHLWLKVALGIWPMLKELKANPESGLLGYELIYMRGFAFVQYWRSFSQLESFSHRTGGSHRAFWGWFNKKVAGSGNLGIWHETYLISSGNYEAVYGNMPLMGLARASKLVPLEEKGQSARQRAGLSPDEEAT